MIEWTQTISIICTVLATGYYIHREVQADIRAANARTDRLYEMFCDLQKDVGQKFYDLLKEMRK